MVISISTRIGILPVSLLFIASIGVFNHVILLPSILEKAGRDAWISVLLTGILYVLWLLLLGRELSKTDNIPVIKHIEDGIGRLPALLIRLLLSGILFLNTYITLKDTVTWTQVSYLVETPTSVILILFASLCLVAAALGLESIAIANGILLPFVILFGIFVASGNFPKKDYSLLWPVLQHGPMPILKGMLYSGIGLAEVIYILFIRHYFSGPMKRLQLVITGVILVMLTFGPLTGSIAIFGPETAAEQRYPAFEQWQMFSLGGYVEHVDFLSIYQWLTGSLIRISFGLWLLVDIWGIRKRRARIGSLGGLMIILLILCRYPSSDITFWNQVVNVWSPLSFAALVLLTLLSLVFLAIGKRRSSNHKEKIVT
ncbi:endospore germination permease [Desmospora activa]|uniref:Spore germination protein (Amino acid permease) n=1 Tax=Desmospora activa DSM 45169 TaxID=1121389 RepID=A0A2T4ZCG5_9BACL|nr:endospore germination permease [Desmospora activa]PTM59571.1 spore germination protein (amino acid permease) [Desmospora activa DSM 45169]